MSIKKYNTLMTIIILLSAVGILSLAFFAYYDTYIDSDMSGGLTILALSLFIGPFIPVFIIYSKFGEEMWEYYLTRKGLKHKERGLLKVIKKTTIKDIEERLLKNGFISVNKHTYAKLQKRPFFHSHVYVFHIRGFSSLVNHDWTSKLRKDLLKKFDINENKKGNLSINLFRSCHIHSVDLEVIDNVSKEDEDFILGHNAFQRAIKSKNLFVVYDIENEQFLTINKHPRKKHIATNLFQENLL